MTRLNRTTLAIIILTVLIGTPVMVWAADHAQAATVTFTFEGSDFLIPRPPAQAPIGERRLVATYDVIGNGYADYIGSVCTFVVTAANGISVHGNNQGYLVTNGSSTDVLRTEDEPNVLRTVLDDPTLRLGETVQLFNIIGEWAEGDNIREGFVGTSVDYEVTATCTIQDDTTTTSTSPTTTSSTLPPSSTTSTIVTTSTTAPEATTTTLRVSSTTAPDTSTTTQPPPSSTSTTIDLTGTSTSTTVPPVSTPSTLPFTDEPGDWDQELGLALAGTALLLLGGGVLVAGRER